MASFHGRAPGWSGLARQAPARVGLCQGLRAQARSHKDFHLPHLVVITSGDAQPRELGRLRALFGPLGELVIRIKGRRDGPDDPFQVNRVVEVGKEVAHGAGIHQTLR